MYDKLCMLHNAWWTFSVPGVLLGIYGVGISPVYPWATKTMPVKWRCERYNIPTNWSFGHNKHYFGDILEIHNSQIVFELLGVKRGKTHRMRYPPNIVPHLTMCPFKGHVGPLYRSTRSESGSIVKVMLLASWLILLDRHLMDECSQAAATDSGLVLHWKSMRLPLRMVSPSEKTAKPEWIKTMNDESVKMLFLF